MALLTLDEAVTIINGAKTAKDLFGPNPEERKKQLLASLHPDRNTGSKRAERAAGYRRKVEALWDEFNRPPVIIKSTKHSYELDQLLAAGDVADIHLAHSGDKNYIIKISRIKDGYLLLDNEHKVLTKLLKAAGIAV